MNAIALALGPESEKRDDSSEGPLYSQSNVNEAQDTDISQTCQSLWKDQASYIWKQMPHRHFQRHSHRQYL